MLCAALAMLTACETAPVTGRSQMMLVGESEERQMGLQAYREVLAREKMSNDARVNALVEKVGRRIADAAEHPPREMWQPPRFRWEFRTVDRNEPNAFCLPGGKVVVYTGILPITRTEAGLAVVMGHEVAHALREHARERAAKGSLTEMGAGLVTSLLGMGDLGRMAVGAGAQLLTLSFSRDNETDADLVGLDLAARAGFDPRAAVRVWEKMSAAAKGAPPQWLSTHPASTTRINEIRRHLGETLPLYARARGTPVASLPPYTSNWGDPIP